MTILPTFVETVSGVCAMVIVAAAVDTMFFARLFYRERNDAVLRWQYIVWALGCVLICLFAAVELPFYFVRAATDPAMVKEWRGLVPPHAVVLLNIRNYGIFLLGAYAIVCGAKLRFPLEDAFGVAWWTPVLMWTGAAFAAGAYLPRMF
jgi:hypothetical protein